MLNLLDCILKNGSKSLLYGFKEIPIVSLGRQIFSFDAENATFIFLNNADKNFSLVDTLYILSGRNDAKCLSFYKPIFKIFGPNDGFFENSLGKRIYEIHGNQLKKSIEKIRNNKFDAKAIVFLNGNDEKLIDCTLTFQLSCQDGEHLDLVANYRANDILEYLPHDSFFFSILLCYCANMCLLKPGKVIILSDRMYIKQSEGKIAEEYKKKLLAAEKAINNIEINKINFKSMELSEVRKMASEGIDILLSYNSKWIDKRKAIQISKVLPYNFKKMIQEVLFNSESSKFEFN